MFPGECGGTQQMHTELMGILGAHTLRLCSVAVGKLLNTFQWNIVQIVPADAASEPGSLDIWKFHELFNILEYFCFK